MQYMKATHRRSTSWRMLTVTTVWNTGETVDIDGGQKDAPLRKANIKNFDYWNSYTKDTSSQHCYAPGFKG